MMPSPKCGTAVNDRKFEKQSKRGLEAFDDVESKLRTMLHFQEPKKLTRESKS